MLSDLDIDRIADRLALRLGIPAIKPVVSAQSTEERLIQLASDPATRALSMQLAKQHSKACRTKRGGKV